MDVARQQEEPEASRQEQDGLADGGRYREHLCSVAPGDAEGKKTYTCEVCGETKTESVPPVESGEPDEPDDPEKPVDPENPSVPVTPVKPLWRSWLEKYLERLPRWWK